jgi:hypothetical protein
LEFITTSPLISDRDALTISYLEKIDIESNICLIFDFSAPLIVKYNSISVFTENSSIRDISGGSKSRLFSFIDDISRSLGYQYLEFLIIERNETDVELNNALAIRYIEELKTENSKESIITLR